MMVRTPDTTSLQLVLTGMQHNNAKAVHLVCTNEMEMFEMMAN